MNKFFIIFFSFFVLGCQANESFLDTVRHDFENVSFDVVEKQLEIDAELPNHIHILISKWFDQKVKINGFEGDMKFTIDEYIEEVTNINDGKRVDISLSFNVILNKPKLSQTKLIKGSVSSYGTMSGNFSLSEFDTLIQNTQSDLVSRLSRDLRSKI